MTRPRSRSHTPARPSWRCSRCGAAWPCGPAKLTLLRLYRDNRIGLLIVLGERLVEAAAELPADVDLYARFVSWARRQDHWVATGR